MKSLYRKRTPFFDGVLIAIAFLVISSAVFGQNVDGIVTDEDGGPLPGATIVIKGTNTFAVTDVDGKFTIPALKTFPFTLQFRILGYRSQQVEVYELTGEPLEIALSSDNLLDAITVTARRRSEISTDVPIPVSIVSGAQVEDGGAFNVNRVKELIPSVQLYSSNPRNTALNVRGLGTTFGLTNDGIDPGVGFYVDGVYYARPAAATLDFIDVERIEVLRGPQGTLFGKNTTAGAFNITTRKPSFDTDATLELSYGNLGYLQVKSSLTGKLTKRLAGRISFTGTHRDGTLYNVAREEDVNTLNNTGVRAQLLYTPTDNVEIILAADATRQRPVGYAQVVAGVVPTQRPEYRQFNAIIADLGYSLPSTNPFDRLIDHDTPWRSDNDLGGLSLNVDAKIGQGTLTSTTAWRYWNWDPSNDRDFTGLQALSRSEGTSRHHNWSQEIRYAGDLAPNVSVVGGVYAIGQVLNTDPVHTEESGSAQWRFSQNSSSELWETPGLLEGFGIRTTSQLNTFSGAVFGQIDWAVTPRLHILPGVRLNFDEKKVDFSRQTYGGLQTDDPALIAIKEVVYTDQEFKTSIDDTKLSGQLTVSYKTTKGLNTYATFATNYKPVGLNLGGLPTSGGVPMLELAEIKPESVRHLEFGIKSVPARGSTLNATFYNTDLTDYQTLVLNSQLGVNRGYLANAEKVRVRGIELDASVYVAETLSLYGAVAYTDGKYVSFKEAPAPLEETGGEPFKDISGEVLPGISKWAGSFGAELSSKARKIVNTEGVFFLAVDSYYRSEFSSSPTPSKYLNVDGYALLNARAGFRAEEGISVFVWARNLTDKDYFEQLLPAAGNAGHYAAVLGDPRTYGATLRYVF